MYIMVFNDDILPLCAYGKARTKYEYSYAVLFSDHHLAITFLYYSNVYLASSSSEVFKYSVLNKGRTLLELILILLSR